MNDLKKKYTILPSVYVSLMLKPKMNVFRTVVMIVDVLQNVTYTKQKKKILK